MTQKYRQYPEYVKAQFDKMPRDEFGSYLASDLAAVKYELPRDGDSWGRWHYNEKLLTLWIHTDLGGYEYEIDLETCTTPAEMLDWIFQLSNKTWMSRKDTGDLVQAFQDLLNPQGTLCSGGMSKTLDVKKHLRRSA